jgi:hypothetical protein
MGLQEDVVNSFNHSFPNLIQEAMIKCVFNSYKISFEICKKYPKEEGHDLLGFLRWVELRAQLRGLGGRFNKIETYEKPNGSASSYHIVIDGETIILTVSSVSFPWVLPRPASYRKEYAIESQFHLFERPQQKSQIYGILIHGSNRENREIPAFLQVRFPDNEYGAYVPYKIDLFANHSQLVKDLLGKPSGSDELSLLEPQINIKVNDEA